MPTSRPIRELIERRYEPYGGWPMAVSIFEKTMEYEDKMQEGAKQFRVHNKTFRGWYSKYKKLRESGDV